MTPSQVRRTPKKKVCNFVRGVGHPSLANIFLDCVFDDCLEREVRPRMPGRCVLIRDGDEFVIGCEREEDARRMLAVVPKRCARFKRTIQPLKSRLGQCQPPRRSAEGDGRDDTSDFLGLTHHWARSRRRYRVLKRPTAKKRLRRARRAVWHWCRAHRHDPLRAPYRALCQKLRGHYPYDGIRGNYRKLEALSRLVDQAWRDGLSRWGGP